MNFKKIVAVGLASVLAVSFTACSSGNTTEVAETAKTGYAVISSINEDEYNPSDTALEIDSVYAGVLVDNDGKVIACKIDEAQTKPDLTVDDGDVSDLRTKLEKKEDYGMKSASAIGAEWYEQISAFENWAIGKTADEITAGIGDDGYPSDADLSAGCTIYASNIAKVVAQAVNSAEDKGAVATDTLAIKVSTEKNYESTETNLQYDSNYAVVTLDAQGKITSCIIDASQAKCTIADGKFTVEKGEFASKKELKEDYGMRSASPIGAEWYEQAEAFENWAVGKTADEIKAGIGDDGYASDADLSAGCTIYASSIAQTVADAATV